MLRWKLHKNAKLIWLTNVVSDSHTTAPNASAKPLLVKMRSFIMSCISYLYKHMGVIHGLGNLVVYLSALWDRS